MVEGLFLSMEFFFDILTSEKILYEFFELVTFFYLDKILILNTLIYTIIMSLNKN